jgi:uncharacterized protein YoxC
MSENKQFTGFALLALAFIVLLVSQVITSAQVHSGLSDANKNYSPVVGQAEKAQQNLESFVSDLLKLANTDEGARQIVEKYQIKQAPNAAAKK